MVLCASEPIDIPGVDCVTYQLEDLGVDNMAHILTSIAPQVLLAHNILLFGRHAWVDGLQHIPAYHTEIMHVSRPRGGRLKTGNVLFTLT